uniref:Uncharacterized protein n=1 Tax=viral metagenome TaxID=1070528 RepID=A0A6C0FBE5_9ZZZZ|tara:strand:+ start:580 stop:1542 length:963 start_codon:yes stop_codon:yes gene_type:complete
MPTGATWTNIHKICIEELLQICENELEKEPREIFRDLELFADGLGYLQPLQMFEYLIELIEDTEGQLRDLENRDLSDARFYCGAESMDSVNALPDYPFDETFLEYRDREFIEVLKQWVKNINRDIKALEDPDAIVPWHIIRYVLHYYVRESKKIMKILEERDPFIVAKKKNINHIREEGYEVGTSVSKKRCLWQIDILRKYFITEGLHPSDVRYESDNFQYYTQDIIIRGNICRWWGNSMWPRFGVGWPKYTPRPRSPSPPPLEERPEQNRPVPNIPINQTKKHITEFLAMIEEKQSEWSMPEGDYLELTQKLKVIFDSV